MQITAQVIVIFHLEHPPEFRKPGHRKLENLTVRSDRFLNRPDEILVCSKCRDVSGVFGSNAAWYLVQECQDCPAKEQCADQRTLPGMKGSIHDPADGNNAHKH